MEKSFYDYQKNKYSVLDELGGTYFLLKADTVGDYYIIEADDEFRASAKPLKSVFNKYDTDVMYDIRGIFGKKGVDEKAAQEQWNQFLNDVVQIVNEEIYEQDQHQREEAARAAGWTPIRDYHFYVDADKGDLVIFDKVLNREHRVTTEDLKSYSKEDVEFFADTWVDGYNTEFGDTTIAARIAENYVRAFNAAVSIVEMTSPEMFSKRFTEEIVKNIDAELVSGVDDDESHIINTITYLKFMKEKKIPFYEDVRLLQNAGGLPYEYQAVANRLRQTLSERTKLCQEDLISKANDICLEKSIKLCAAQQNLDIDESVNYLIEEKDGVQIRAVGAKDTLSGADLYRLEAKTNDTPLLFNSPIVVGVCRSEELNKYLGVENGSKERGDLAELGKSGRAKSKLHVAEKENVAE